MSRNLSIGSLLTVTGEVVHRATAVELLFPAGPVRWNGTPRDLIINGNVFLGIGALGSISVIEEGAELRAYGITVQVSAIPRDMVALALGQNYSGKAATVWEVPLSDAGDPVADPIVAFRGRMDQMDISLGSTATVTVRLENRLADWDRPRIRRYTDADQKTRFPNDQGFRFVSATTDKELVWPDKGFFQ